MRLLILSFGLILLGIHCQSQSTVDTDSTSIINEIEAAGKIKVNVPVGLINQLSAAEETMREAGTDGQAANESGTKKTSRVGYRVQVFDDNNVRTAKHDAEARKRQVESRFPEFRVYIQFNSPYWRVKAGDFRTRSEADAAMAAIRAAFPGFGSQLRIVRDHINSH